MKTSHLSKSVQYLLPLLDQRCFNYSQHPHSLQHISVHHVCHLWCPDGAHRRVRQWRNIPHKFADQNLITSDMKDGAATEHVQCFPFICRKHSFKTGTRLCKDIWWYATLLKNHITVLIQGGQGPPKAVQTIIIIIVLILWLWHHLIVKYHRCSKLHTLWER
jgi:hypothetical protein